MVSIQLAAGCLVFRLTDGFARNALLANQIQLFQTLCGFGSNSAQRAAKFLSAFCSVAPLLLGAVQRIYGMRLSMLVLVGCFVEAFCTAVTGLTGAAPKWAQAVTPMLKSHEMAIITTILGFYALGYGAVTSAMPALTRKSAPDGSLCTGLMQAFVAVLTAGAIFGISAAEAAESSATGTAGTAGGNATRSATRSTSQERKELEAEHWKLLDVSPADQMCGSTDVQSMPEALRPSCDETAVQRCLDSCQNGLGLEHLHLDAMDAMDAMDAEGFHSLLLAAIRQPEGSCDLLNRILRSWACCLLNRHEGLAIKTAVTMGNLEALEALVSLGGPSAVATATALPADNGQDASAPALVERTEGLLCSCAAKGDSASLALLLEHLHDRRTLEIIRKARAVAAQHGHCDVSQLLATHLVVELSYVGNSKYRAGEYDSAIGCYQEAIDLCEEHGGPGASRASPASTSVASCHRDNLVRLRYNLARAFHRSDRWMQAREQATLVLQLDSQYLNAYALRAQAAMSALDWAAAKEDWERLLERGAGPHSSPEVLRAWRRRQDECCRQLAQDHYETLGLPPLAEPEEVRRAYRDLARRWHPDKHQSRSLDLRGRAAQRFTRIRHAYEVLSDEGLKQRYDTQLQHEARPPASRGGLGSHSKEPESDIEPHWADHEQTL